MMARPGREFYKMSGSGNDFVIFDARVQPAADLLSPATVRAICARATGVGADGVVVLEPAPDAAFRMTYFNSDGSRASLCGNASLCVTRLAVELGAVGADAFSFHTDAGPIRARMYDGSPEIAITLPSRVSAAGEPEPEQGERRLGFALVGVPHLVVLCEDVELVDVARRGAELRRHPSCPDGANVNFLSGLPHGGWAIRTFERGVEGETLACGTGAVAGATLLERWGLSGQESRFRTRSGNELLVRLPSGPDNAVAWLRGEARLVFRGTLGQL